MLEADNADEARSLLVSRGHVDALITDIRMPGSIDGVELAKWTRKRFPNIKTIIVSAYIGPYWDTPVDATFAKPIRFELILTRLRQLLPPGEQASSGNR